MATWCGGGVGGAHRRRRRPQFRERPLLRLGAGGPAERRRRREDDGTGRRRLSHSPLRRNCCRRWRTLDGWACGMGEEGAFLLLFSLSDSTLYYTAQSPSLPLSLPSTPFYVTDDVSGMALRSLAHWGGRAHRKCLLPSFPPFLNFHQLLHHAFMNEGNAFSCRFSLLVRDEEDAVSLSDSVRSLPPPGRSADVLLLTATEG